MAAKKAPAKARGVYERERGSGIWWIRYQAEGKARREKVGRRSDAIVLYQKRKADVRIGVKLPDNLRERTVSVGNSGARRSSGIKITPSVTSNLALLRVPFNLRLAAELLDGGMEPGEFSPLRDQVGILEAYWRRRVAVVPDGDGREQVLRLCPSDMVANRRLRTCRAKALESGGTHPLLT